MEKAMQTIDYLAAGEQIRKQKATQFNFGIWEWTRNRNSSGPERVTQTRD